MVKTHLFQIYAFPLIFGISSQWRYIFLILLGKLLDHVLIEMGYGLKSKGQDSKKQSADPGENTD